MGSRSVLINLLGDGGGASHALRGVGDDAERAARRVDRLDESNRRASEGGNVFTRSMASMGPAAGRAAASIGLVAAQIGTVIPAAAGLSAAVIQIAPAAAVAATGIAAVGLAGGALKIGMAGVGESIKQAFSAKGTPEKLAKAMKNLSPNARAFVAELLKLKPALGALKTTVQDALFEGLDKQFATTARATLPALRAGLAGAAAALNNMAFQALGAVRSLAKSGTLGTLFRGATGGLSNLGQVPAQLIKGFVQIGAAAAPVFQSMTKGAADLATRLSGALSGAFKSGAMTQAINIAVGLLKQLGTVAVNVFKIVGNIFGAAQASGGGFVGTLQKVTAALAQVSANPAFQQGLRAIFAVMSQLATTAAPLLAQALLAIAPIFTALGPPLQVLIQALGAALQPVIAALGPVLVAVAQAVGALVVALAPLLPVIGQVIAALLPILVPVLQLLTTVLTALTPVIAVVAQALTTYLVPVITAVVGVVTNVINWFKNLAEQVFPAVVAAVSGAGGPLAGLKQALSDLWTAVQPLAAALWDLVQRVFVAIKPAIGPIITVAAELARIFTAVLVDAINNVLIPAINGLTALLNGNATASIKGYAKTVGDATASIVQSLQSLPGKTTPVLYRWGIEIGNAVIKAVGDMIDKVLLLMVKLGRNLPGALRAAVGAMGTAAAAIGKAVLAALNIAAPELVWAVKNWVKGMVAILKAAVPPMFAIGKSIITGLANGVKSAVGGLFAELTSIAGKVSGIFSHVLDSHSPSRVMIGIGHDVMDGLNIGLKENAEKVYGTLGKIGSKIGELVVAGSGALVPVGDLGKKLRAALTKGADEITTVIKDIRGKVADAFKSKLITADQRDGLLDYLTATNAKLRTLAKERQAVVDKIKEIQDYAKKITDSVLSYAAITQIKGADGAAPTGGQLVAGLQARLATIREFGANIKKLAGAGLSKALLGQILDAGIDGGAAIAAELANGPSSIIAALNTAQTQITKVAKNIGIDGADALFGSGKAMGDAFLKGLKSLEKALVDQMELLVEKLLKALGKGVDGAKGKLAEMVETSAKLTELAVTATKLGDYNPGPQPKGPTPLKAPAAAPVYAPAPPKPAGGGVKTVSVNIGGVNVKDRVDADMLMNNVVHSIRGAVF